MGDPTCPPTRRTRRIDLAALVTAVLSALGSVGEAGYAPVRSGGTAGCGFGTFALAGCPSRIGIPPFRASGGAMVGCANWPGDTRLVEITASRGYLELPGDDKLTSTFMPPDNGMVCVEPRWGRNADLRRRRDRPVRSSCIAPTAGRPSCTWSSVPQPRSAWVSRRTEPEHERFLLSDPTHHVGHDRHQDTVSSASE
jgi:hypothetical protein